MYRMRISRIRTIRPPDNGASTNLFPADITVVME
jgi:hypothetical protein